ncbi:MAG: DMT family transporter [Cytophagaceae bacterium]|nr:DMT family transporter [Cytophagaceae bacterium]MBK9935426.1 DMT family transporter [Cytophagaceae bacterium]MBL0301868.1 DMT family transporter [Cytophagaceae bacterium]
MNQKHKGIILMAIGAICFSAKAIFIKLTYQQFDIDDITLLTLRFGMSLPFFMIIGLFRYKKGHFKAVSGKDFGIIALLSLLGYYWASWFDFRGLQYISAGLERIILFSYPTLVIIFSSIFLGKKISRNGVIALVITYLGIAIIALDPKILSSKNFALGAGLVLISSVTYALYLTFGGEMIKKYGSINFNTLAMIFSSVYVIIHFEAFTNVAIFELPDGVYLYGLALAIVSTVIPTFLVMEGIKLLGAGLGSIVGSIGPVATVILGYIFLGETLSLQEILGSVLVLIGVLIIGK